ncbi:MAG: hypothetical protein JW939_05425, partial [Candidatus Thermoplasmatota archaeon]|nr:hypothetical protein [Candidatus Thermoplasmatota archaeon]
MSKYASKVKEKGRSRARDTFEVDSSLLKGEWVRCPKCYEELRSDNLERHLGKVHHVKMVQMDRGKNELLPLIGLIIVVMLVLGGIGVYFIVTGNKGDDGGGVDIPDEGWLDTYSPKEKVGSSDDDWWTVYPHQNPNDGDMPDHPSWITEKLKSGPVLVFAHSDNCVPCIQQQESV